MLKLMISRDAFKAYRETAKKNIYLGIHFQSFIDSVMKVRLLKINQFLFFWVLLTIVLYYGKVILVPIAFAIMLAMLMAPVCRWLDNKGFSRVFSTIICLLILILVFSLVIWIIAAQLMTFSQQVPLFEEKIESFLHSINIYIEENFNIPASNQQDYLEKKTENLGSTVISYIRNFLGSITSLIAGLTITLVVTFLLLYNKERYERFFLMLGNPNNKEERKLMLNDITKVSQQYLTGRAISMLVLFILYTIALLFIGLENALLLSAIAAIINIIPYLGPLLAGVFPVLVALVSFESFSPMIWVIISFSVIQGIDNYFVTPSVLGGEVSLSALSTILIIICGGFIWGIAGMILFIPMLSIAKIIFDHVPSLMPYGYLIGDPDNKRPSSAFKEWLNKKLKRN